MLQALARRAGQDVEAAVERVAVANPGEFRLAAAEQPRKQLREVPVQLLEGGDEPPAAFLVQRADPLPQPRDRLGQIGPLALQIFEAGLAPRPLPPRGPGPWAAGPPPPPPPVQPPPPPPALRRAPHPLPSPQPRPSFWGR